MEQTAEEVAAEETAAEETKKEETAEAIIENAKPAEEAVDEQGKLHKILSGESKKKALKEEIEKLKKENEELKGKNDILRNEYARAYADTENIRKRLYKENEMNNKYRAQSFALEVLPVLDNCERALAVESQDENYRKGFEMVYRSLVNALKKEGVEEIEALNQPFDPNWHQAMMAEPVEGVEPGTVVQ
ncbi:MAG: nucleotide exchange factor GrpE, partial [Solobacterium sp.]|nr:nucleotide exchange factor GrpE [Solobacterium sp.]